jgi:nicotinate-nucleotide pyrophosphorylase (carboxylating)
MVLPPPDHIVDDLVWRALAEDLGRAGDVTTNSVIPPAAVAQASIVARATGTIAGLDAALHTFAVLDPEVKTAPVVGDGDEIVAGTELATLTGSTRALLTGERTALNILGYLSGIATAVREVVARVAPTGAHVVDTRKTTPGLRALAKYAVRCGGGGNHRLGLDDAVMIKDNHLAAAGSIAAAVAAARAAVGHLVKVEVEVDDLDQLREALTTDVDVILLDNMTPDQLREAVAITAGRCLLEASGGITPDNVLAVAETGVDLVSMGWITHSAPNLDVALDLR